MARTPANPAGDRPATSRRMRRERGRPPGEGTALRDAMLDCALERFASHGVAATPLAAIARAAGATPALLHYYFGSRDGLLDALVAERLRALIAPLATELAAGARDAPPIDRLRVFASAYARTVAAHPHVPRLIVREVLSEGGALRGRFAAAIAQGPAAAVVQAIGAAQAAGQLRADVPPPALALAMMSLIVFPFVAAPVLGPVLGIAVGPQHAEQLAARQWLLFCEGAAT